jgi:hypothetical protein
VTDLAHFEKLAAAVVHDADAARFCGQVCAAAHLFDDLADRDRAVSPDEVLQAFRALLVEIPANRFYRAHFEQLHPLFDACLLSWGTANRFEAAGGEERLRIAYVIRSDYMNLVLRCAQIVGGFEYAERVAPKLRELWHAEGWDGYLKALELQREAQGA